MALVRPKVLSSDINGDIPLTNLNTLKSTNIGAAYIKSKKSSINCTIEQHGDISDTDSGCSVYMGNPNSVTSTFFIEASGQYHLDTYQTGDNGNYTGLSIQRRIDGGTWTTIYRQGDWAHGSNDSNDFNNRAIIHWRDHPATTGTVEYRIGICTHRNGAYWGRIPANNLGGNMQLIVFEYDTGETA